MLKPIIISLGGSLIYPKNIDINFLKQFRKIILQFIKKTKRQVILVTGGGRICRIYNEAAKSVYKKVNEEELDWMGIKATKVNAELVRIIFGNAAYFKVIDHPDKRYRTNKKVLVAGGWKPGFSSDRVAVELAKSHGADMVINLSNISYVYNKDPKKYKNATKFKKISWNDFRKIVGNKWNPGANLPFDPIASKFAQKYKLKVIIAKGTDLKNLRDILEAKNYKGTLIY